MGTVRARLPRGTAVLGVDGCRGRWVGALVTRDAVAWLDLTDAAEVLAVPAAAVGIDVPIGLPDDGPRACDRAARRLLGARGASVFPAPVRAALSARDHREACALSRRASGRALPLQAWHLVPGIADVDRRLTPEVQRRVVEVHPEVSFHLLAGLLGLARPLPPKRSREGAAPRMEALAAALPPFALRDAPARSRTDDRLDALACAWSAARWLAGTATVLPDGDPPCDTRGLRMEIVA